jgi:hypothetical protein
MDYLNPTASDECAGILHRNHLALIARGPWVKAQVLPAQFETVRDADAAGGYAEVQKVQGTCDVCSSPIKDVVVFWSAAGERITLGLDCAHTFQKHLSAPAKKALDAGEKKLRQVKAAAAKKRKAERNQKTFAALLEELATLAQVEGFPGQFARSVALQVRDGKKPSEKQLALLEKLKAEQAGR